MNYFTQPQLFISAKAKKLGLQLIQELYIQRSTRLAFYLDVNPSFDGHEAILFWTEHFLVEYPDANFSDIQHQFIRSVPQYWIFWALCLFGLSTAFFLQGFEYFFLWNHSKLEPLGFVTQRFKS